MSFASSTSMPLGSTTEVPLSVPTWNPGAGGVRPTVSVPGLSVGGAAVRLAPAVAAIRLTASTPAISARTIFFTVGTPGMDLTRTKVDDARSRECARRPANHWTIRVSCGLGRPSDRIGEDVAGSLLRGRARPHPALAPLHPAGRVGAR